jgi:hypothetical protein
MSGRAALASATAPPRLTSRVCHQSAGSSSQAGPADDAGVVDQDVHRAELLAEPGHGGLQRPRVGDVRGRGRRGSSGPRDLIDGRGELVA